MSATLSRDAIARRLRQRGVPKDMADRAADREAARNSQKPATNATREHRQIDPWTSAPVVAHRIGDVLLIVIETPPRSKKNGGKGKYFGIDKGDTPYKKYELEIKEAVDEVRAKLQLPLPDQPYNIQATYFVDDYGARADRPGLDQALFDALQHAKVISDDWWLRTTDGTRIVEARTAGCRPRVEALITPLAPLALDTER